MIRYDVCLTERLPLDTFEFEAVVLVPSSYRPSKDGFSDLKGGGLCHPGFSDTQIWNDYILKHFEKSVYDFVCNDNLTVVENEVKNLGQFFGKACRPGEWAAERSIDSALSKYHFLLFNYEFSNCS